MFRQLAQWNAALAAGPAPQDVLAYHPAVLERYLEERWTQRMLAPERPAEAIPPPLFGQLRDSGLAGIVGAVPDDIYPIGAGGLPVAWYHLIYAYMLEQTRIVEIFRRTAIEALHGEYLGELQPASHAWVRNVEWLLFSDLPSGHIARVTSSLRPDPGAVRRNAYWRMFGLDLNEQGPDGAPYPYLKAKVANREFVRLLEEFLREVWRGIENFTNSSGPNSTDPATIAHLASLMSEMLRVRRANGMLSREEFAAVASLDFLRLTIDFDTPIVEDLQAQATSADERLRKCGERVGIRSHPKTEAYLQLAEDLSLLLTAIEADMYSQSATAVPLYATTPVRDMMLRIIRDWSAVTGRDMKARHVTVTPRQPAPPPAERVARPAATGVAATARPRPAPASANGARQPVG